jgi:hypothetical protein
MGDKRKMTLFINGKTYEAGEFIAYVKNLEIENAELKKQVEQKQHLADVRLEQALENYKRFSDEQKKRIDIEIVLEDTTDQLTKATDFLKGVIEVFVTAPTQFSERQKKDLFEDIEQFLSDIKEG